MESKQIQLVISALRHNEDRSTKVSQNKGTISVSIHEGYDTENTFIFSTSGV